MNLISLNIERSRHFATVLPFLKEQSPDVVCMQELMEYDVAMFERELGMKSLYTPMMLHPNDGKAGGTGNGLFYRGETLAHGVEYYWGEPYKIQFEDLTNEETKRKTVNHLFIWADILIGDTTYRIATTHFVWTPKGGADETQRESADKMLKLLRPLAPLVLCGDFNAPRVHAGVPGEIYSRITTEYSDAIPLRCGTSIDVDLHRYGKIRPEDFADKMVDYIFHSPEYSVSDVKLHFGLSDHAAVTATISRK